MQSPRSVPFTLSRVSRRRLLAAGLGLGLGLVVGNPRRSARSQPEDDGPRRLMWVWQFSSDGAPDEIGRQLLNHRLGIVIKTHDGPRWMAEFDESEFAIDGPVQVATLANYYESAGVPFYAWCVLQGSDPETEARMAADVLDSGARALYIDPGIDDGPWEGDGSAAKAFGEEVRRLVPEAPIILTLDPRPWLMQDIPVADLAPFCNAIAVKALWNSYDSDDDHDGFFEARFSVPEEGVTPEFIYAAGWGSFASHGLPLTWLADAAADEQELARFLKLVHDGDDHHPGIWRYGTSTESTFRALGIEVEEEDESPEESAGELRAATHVVEEGETLWDIAETYDVSVDDIVALNDLDDEDMIREGQELLIP
jgi:hypothetical protein